MNFPSPLLKGRLIKRYKRFLADVQLETGDVITAHCPNPGSMLGLKTPDSECWVSRSDNPKRKLQYTLEIMRADGTLVAINTNNPNTLAREAIENGTIAPLAEFTTLRREVAYGANSRIGLLLEGTPDGTSWVEVKNCHLMRTPGLAEFPDSVTKRGTKHLGELALKAQQGDRAVQLFIVQRADCRVLRPAEDLDPEYAKALRSAASKGVEVYAHACEVSLSSIQVSHQIEVEP